MSPSLRGRGLKFPQFFFIIPNSQSPSLRGRGLKCRYRLLKNEKKSVALFTRAWIEIHDIICVANEKSVALFTRAWIEIV